MWFIPNKKDVTPQSLILISVKLIDSKSTQSRTTTNYNSSLAIDGNTETCSITEQDSATEEKPWWRVELDRIYNITDLQIYYTSKRC